MRLIDADAMRQEWLENGENEYIYDTNAVLDSIDAQPTVSRWIPVTERPPDVPGHVLVWDNTAKLRKILWYHDCNGWGVEDKHPKRYFGNASDQRRYTHWMPLPDEPKEEGHAEGSMSFRETAKVFGIKEREFIGFLLAKKLVYRNSHGKLIPYMEKRQEKWFEVAEVSYQAGTETRTMVYTKITPVGRQKIAALLGKEGL